MPCKDNMALSNCRLIIQVFISLLEIFLYGGLQYGWASLLYVLKQEKVYEDLCVNDTNTTSDVDDSTSDGCFAQDQMFALLFSIGMAVFIVSGVFLGQLYTKYVTATRTIRLCSMATLVVGALCFGFTSTDVAWLVLPGIILVGVSGASLFFSNLQVAVLLPKWSSTYVGLLTGSMDSSVLTQMVVKILYESGINLRFAYIGIAILCVVISGLCTLLHPGSGHKTSSPSDGRSSVDIEVSSKTTVTKKDDVTPTSVTAIICSRTYIFHVMWMSVLLLRLFYFIGSINSVITTIVEIDDLVSHFTNVLSYTMLGGLLSSFIAGHVVEIQKGTMKTVIPLTVTSCLAILLSSLAFLSSTHALYANFVVLTFFRSFVFSVNVNFIMISYQLKYVSVLVGLVTSAAGVITLTQYALFTWTEAYDGAMLHVNSFLLILSVVSLLHPVYIWMTQKRGSRDEGVEINVSVISENVDVYSTKL